MSSNPYAQRRSEYGDLLEHSLEEQLLEAIHDLGAMPGINTTRIAELAARVIDRSHQAAVAHSAAVDERVREHTRELDRFDQAARAYRKAAATANANNGLLRAYIDAARDVPQTGRTKAHQFAADLAAYSIGDDVEPELDAAIARADPNPQMGIHQTRRSW